MNETVKTNSVEVPATNHQRWILFLIAFYVVWALRATVFYSLDETIASTILRQLYGNILRFLIWVVPVIFYLKYVDHEKPLEYLKLTTRMRSPLVGFAIVALYILAIPVFEHYTSGKTIFGKTMSSYEWTQTLLWLPGPPIMEEIFYRGFVLQKLREVTRFWLANLITSILFIMIHWPYWFYSGQPARQVLSQSIPILPMSLVLGFLVKKTNSLYPSIAFHLLNNFASVLLNK
jgi:membrane protease YdiL (CAAX protease family)